MSQRLARPQRARQTLHPVAVDSVLASLPPSFGAGSGRPAPRTAPAPSQGSPPPRYGSCSCSSSDASAPCTRQAFLPASSRPQLVSRSG
eukprot:1682307-Rhodomonas_salina.2